MMDINVVRSVVTVVTFALFIGICWWAYRRKSQPGFDVAAQLPFVDTVADPRQSREATR